MYSACTPVRRISRTSTKKRRLPSFSRSGTRPAGSEWPHTRGKLAEWWNGGDHPFTAVVLPAGGTPPPSLRLLPPPPWRKFCAHFPLPSGLGRIGTRGGAELVFRLKGVSSVFGADHSRRMLATVKKPPDASSRGNLRITGRHRNSHAAVQYEFHRVSGPGSQLHPGF